MTNLNLVLVFVTVINADSFNSIEDSSISHESMSFPPTRRILKGNQAGETRPYMVYLRATHNSEPKIKESNWICGGVIIDKRFILTSAACVEDAKHFIVISGTHTFVPLDEEDNACVRNGAKRAVWKCVPKSYFFDGNDFDNIRWMVGDIAIVKVEDDFNFERKIRGCDFIPKKVPFNNVSLDHEKPGITASIAGWGTTDKYYVETDYTGPLRSAVNSVELLETDVVLISKKGCKSRWEERYHFIINDEMICTKDSVDSDHMNTVCKDAEVLCRGLEETDNDDYYTDEPKNNSGTRMILDPAAMIVHTAAHQDPSRRRFRESGGFCENDHGGPLVVGRGKAAMVIGIMSACLTNSVTNKCYGPFLFTSVYKYRTLISCAIDRNNDPSCSRLLRIPKNQIQETPIRPSHELKNSKSHDLNGMHGISHARVGPVLLIATRNPFIGVTHKKTPVTQKIDPSKTTAAFIKPLTEERKPIEHVEKQNKDNIGLKKLVPNKPSQSAAEWLQNIMKRKQQSHQERDKLRVELKEPPMEKLSNITTVSPYPSIKALIMRKFFTSMY